MSGPFKRDGVDGTNDDSNDFVVLWGTAAITAGQCVVLDLTDSTYGVGKSVKKSAANDDPLACGIAHQTITAAGPIKVQIKGRRTDCTARGGNISAGAMVGAAGTGGDDGGVKSLGTPSATVWPFAVCVNAFTDDTADGEILILDRGFFK